MTNQEAIANLNMIRIAFVDPVTNEQRKLIDDTFDNAIKALEELPKRRKEAKRWRSKAHQMQCEDAISRQAINNLQKYRYNCGETSITCVSLADINELPSVNQTKTGHWIRWYEKKDFGLYIENIPHCKCSECDTEYDSYSSQFIKYCNGCGAKMVRTQESEDK